MEKKPNRFYSKKQEQKVADNMGFKRTKNSGATMFDKGDVKGDAILVECKTLTTSQKSHTIKKEWLDKNEEEAFSRGKQLSVLAFNFGPNEVNYFIVREDDFKNIYEAWRNQFNE